MERNRFKLMVQNAHKSLISGGRAPRLSDVYEAVSKCAGFRCWDHMSVCLRAVDFDAAAAAVRDAMDELGAAQSECEPEPPDALGEGSQRISLSELHEAMASFVARWNRSAAYAKTKPRIERYFASIKLKSFDGE